MSTKFGNIVILFFALVGLYYLALYLSNEWKNR